MKKKTLEAYIASTQAEIARLRMAVRILEQEKSDLLRDNYELRRGMQASDIEVVAQFLYHLLDDIDTADDIAKDDDAAYRRLVQHIQRRKSLAVSACDGNTVTLSRLTLLN